MPVFCSSSSFLASITTMTVIINNASDWFVLSLFHLFCIICEQKLCSEWSCNQFLSLMLKCIYKMFDSMWFFLPTCFHLQFFKCPSQTKAVLLYRVNWRHFVVLSLIISNFNILFNVNKHLYILRCQNSIDVYFCIYMIISTSDRICLCSLLHTDNISFKHISGSINISLPLIQTNA